MRNFEWELGPVTDDPLVKDTLRFLMTREVAHFQMFEAALGTIQPNFPPGILQSDPRHSNTYFNMSKGDTHKGPWNQGQSTQLGETWQYIDNPQKFVNETNGLTNIKPAGTDRTDKTVTEHNDKLAKERSKEIKNTTPPANIKWSEYDQKK